MLIDGRRMVTTTLLMLGGQISATLAGAAMGSDATTIEIAPGVRMPYVSDGIILDAGRWSRNHTGEVKGLDLFFKLGGRGVDTAWSCQYHHHFCPLCRQHCQLALSESTLYILACQIITSQRSG